MTTFADDRDVENELTIVIDAADQGRVLGLFDDVSERAATIIPERPRRAGAPQPRPIASVAPRDLYNFFGAVVSALCTTLLLVGRVTPLSGKLGFVVIFALLFVVIYGVLVSLDDSRVAVIDRLMSVLMTYAALFAIGALASVVLFTIWRGRSAILRWNMYTQDMSVAGPQEPLSVGGVSHAIVGTLMMMAIALTLTVAVSIACSVYLTEGRGRFTELVRSVVTAMTALPSVIAGLFILATWILLLGYPQSGFAASLAISVMMMPIIIRSADVVLRLVPGNLREAAEALGAPSWRVVWHVVLPTARSGLATSVILGVARGVGETAPVLLVAGNAAVMNVNPFENSMNSLPLATFRFVSSGVPTLEARGFAAACILMVLVLVLFSIARLIGGRPAGRLSKSQQRRAAQRSLRDLERFDAREAHRAIAPSNDPQGSPS